MKAEGPKYQESRPQVAPKRYSNLGPLVDLPGLEALKLSLGFNRMSLGIGGSERLSLTFQQEQRFFFHVNYSYSTACHLVKPHLI